MILLRVRAAQQHGMPVADFHLDEMPGCELFRAQLHRKLQKRLELDLPVGQHVGIAGCPLALLAPRIGLEHALLIGIDGVKRNADGLADCPARLRIGGRGAYAVFILLVPVLHEHADHVVALPL